MTSRLEAALALMLLGACAAPSAPLADDPPQAPARSVPAPSVDRTRDDRIALRPRAVALLKTEVHQIEQLLAAMARDAKDRPLLLLRLATNYAELEYASADDANQRESARVASIHYYALLARDYPDDPRMDQVAYYIGFEYERGGEDEKARAAYRDLVARFPSSPYVARVPEAMRP